MQRVTARTSTIFIGVGNETLVYGSMAEVPAPLRRRLRDSAQSSDTVRIVIADKRGRMELARVAESLSSARRECVEAEITRSVPVPERGRRRARSHISLRSWLELLLPIAVGASLWFFIGSK